MGPFVLWPLLIAKNCKEMFWATGIFLLFFFGGGGSGGRWFFFCFEFEIFSVNSNNFWKWNLVWMTFLWNFTNRIMRPVCDYWTKWKTIYYWICIWRHMSMRFIWWSGIEAWCRYAIFIFIFIEWSFDCLGRINFKGLKIINLTRLRLGIGLNLKHDLKNKKILTWA